MSVPKIYFNTVPDLKLIKMLTEFLKYVNHVFFLSNSVQNTDSVILLSSLRNVQAISVVLYMLKNLNISGKYTDCYHVLVHC